MKKRIISVILAATMVTSLVGCGGSANQTSSANDVAATTANAEEGTAAESSEPAVAATSVDLNDAGMIDNTVERASINIAWQDATTLAPWGTRNDTPGNYEVYEMLYECTSKGERYGILADTSKGSYVPGCDHEDGTGIYTVYIYDYIKDHNGRAVTASDVAYSYNYQFNNEDTSGWGDFIEARPVDDTTVEFEFSAEQNTLGWFDNFFCRCFIVNQESFEELNKDLSTNMCGTGPYKFVSYTSGSSLVIEKNDDYWQTDDSLRNQSQQANVRTITFQFISENAQRENGIATGSLDMVQDMAYESTTEFADGGKYADIANVQTYSQKFIYYLDTNNDQASIMSDVNMRNAIFYSIDQDGLITALGGGYKRLYAYANDYYSDYDMVDWASLDNYNTKTSVDAEKVKGYLDAAGYNGETIKLLIMSTFGDVGTIIAAQCAAMGINVELIQVDNATAAATENDPTAWDIYFGMMAGDYNVQAWAHDFSYGNTPEGNRTLTFIQNDEWEALLNECNTNDGHTAENMQAWWNMCVDNAYAMGVFAGNNFNIVPEDCVYVHQGDKLRFLPGACCYKAQ